MLLSLTHGGARAAGAGIRRRDARADELGYAGLAQSRGHRTPVAMVQSITGTTRAEAARQVRLGHLMGEADAATTLAGSGARAGQAQEGEPAGSEGLAGVTGPVDGEEQAGGTSPVLPWYEPLTRAVQRRTLTAEAVAAITRALGEPNDRVGAEQMRAAAEELVRDAGDAHVDELARRARQLRDRIDPDRGDVTGRGTLPGAVLAVRPESARGTDGVRRVRRRVRRMDGCHRGRGTASETWRTTIRR